MTDDSSDPLGHTRPTIVRVFHFEPGGAIDLQLQGPKPPRRTFGAFRPMTATERRRAGIQEEDGNGKA